MSITREQYAEIKAIARELEKMQIGASLNCPVIQDDRPCEYCSDTNCIKNHDEFQPEEEENE